MGTLYCGIYCWPPPTPPPPPPHPTPSYAYDISYTVSDKWHFQSHLRSSFKFFCCSASGFIIAKNFNYFWDCQHVKHFDISRETQRVDIIAMELLPGYLRT